MNEATSQKGSNKQQIANKQAVKSTAACEATISAPPRRRALLGAMLGLSAGAVATSSLPHGWTRPVITAVLTPAHAQTSLVPMQEPRPPGEVEARVYVATGLRGTPQVTRRSIDSAGELLAGLNEIWLSSAHASTGVPPSFCQVVDPVFEGSFSLYFTVTAENLVTIAMQGNPAFRVGGSEVVCAGMTSLVAGELVDTDVQIGLAADPTDPDCVLRLSSMLLVDDVLSGSWSLLLPEQRSPNDGLPILCEGAFIAVSSDAVPMAQDCRGLELQV